MKLKLLIASLFAFPVCLSAAAQDVFTHDRSESYIWPKDEKVMEKLDQWQDLKFGMIIHYGLYSELGVVESWPLCSELEDWIPRDSTVAYDDFKKWYWGAIDKFAPTELDPESWADYGKKAGMKYLVFTTKHCDGFNLFDTRYSDFKITNGAFRDHPRNNIVKEVFTAFRDRGYMIGAYYAKPDWHSEYYWWPRYATPTRNQNYNINTNPWRWGKFKEFIHNQVEELVNGDYGGIDILWLDGGWVKPTSPERAAALGPDFLGSQDIDIPKLAAMARSYQPGLLVVDRTVAGEYENYQTPERAIPATQVNNPWESCITLGSNWGYIPNEPMHSAASVIHNLAEITAKGGCLLLGIGPDPTGKLPEKVIERLEEIGQWTSRNGDAIYSTRTTPVYNDGQTWFTCSKDSKTIYATVCLEEGAALPKTVRWKGNEPLKGTRMTLLETGKTVKWKKTGDGIEVIIPDGLRSNLPALAFSYAVAK